MARLALALAVLVASRAAAADPDSADDLSTYRGAIMASDVVATGLLVGGAAMAWSSRDCECEELGSGYLILFGAGAYVMAPAMIHREAGRLGRGVASTSLRLALPLAGVAVARTLERDAGTTLTFAAGGMVTAMLVDWLVLARDRPARAAPAISIYAAPVTGGAIGGVAGRL